MPDAHVLGPYELTQPLGSGGMGVVWAATHRRWGTPVAVKVLREAHRPEAVAALHAEVRTIASLDHPGIVAVHDQGVVPEGVAGRVAGSPWLAMERAAQALARPEDWSEARSVLGELLDALAAAHAAGVLHLDVKPSNVLRRADGSVALADFGIAVLRSAEGASASESSWGSPPYMAPERFDGRLERLTPATDLYAVGCLAFELLHHAVPFGARTWQEAAFAHRTLPVPTLVPRIPVPLGIAAWVHTLLAKRPGDRFQHAADARAALDALGEPVTGQRDASRPAVPSGPTLTATVPGEAVAMGELLSTAPAPPAAPLSPRWVVPAPRPPRHASGGLLGLLGVPFVGRQQALRAGWQALAAGRSVRLRGPWGVGRSRLGRRLMQQAAAAGVAVVAVGHGDEPRPVHRALQQVLALPEPLDPVRRDEAVALRLRRPVDDPLTQRVLAALTGAADPLDGLRAWATSRQRPVWAWVDDGLTEPVLAFLEAWEGPVLASASDGLLARWPERAARWRRGAEELVLAPLDEADIRKVLADWVGLSPAVVTEAAWRCEGDLALAVRLVSDGVEARRLVAGSDGWTRADEAPWPLPSEVVARWAERAAEAALPEGPTLRAAAAVAGTVPLAWLPGDDAERQQVRAAVVAHGLGSPVEAGWRWASAALRAALLDGHDPAVAHRAVAERIGDDDAWIRGQHRLLGGEVRAGADDMLSVAATVIARGRMVEAARWLRRIREAMQGRVPEADPLWGRLIYTHAVLGPTHQGYARTMAFAQEAVDRSAGRFETDPGWREVRKSALGILIWLANVQLLPKVAGPALQAWEELGEDEERVLATHHDRLGWHRLTVGDPEGSMRSFARARDLSGKVGRRTQYVADTSLGVAMRHAGHPDAVDHLTTAGAAMLQAGFASARADLAYALGDAERHRGRPDVALSHYDEALRASAEGDARADIGFLVGRALCLAALGRRDEAVAALRGCQQQLDDDGPTWEAVVHLHLLAHGPLPDDADEVHRWLQQLDGTGFVDPDVALSMARLARRLAGVGRPLPALRAAAARQRAPYPKLSPAAIGEEGDG